MCSVPNKFRGWLLCPVLFLAGSAFAQSDVSFELKGNNNEVHNSQSVTYTLDVDVLICADHSLAGGGEIKSVNAFMDLVSWCTGYLDARAGLADSAKKVLYTNVYEIKNSNDETATLRLINETLSLMQRLYQQSRSRMSSAEIDVFHRKYDELRSFRILNCLGDRFRLKKSNISDGKYLESDPLSADVRAIDFELFAMSEGIRMVRVNGRYGYTENDSTFSIAPVFSMAHPFSNGLALVKNHTETWFINKKGIPVLSLASRGYVNVWPFSGGYARVEKGNRKYNFIDVSGRELFTFDFHDADDFSLGLAAVCINPARFYEKIKALPGYKKHAEYLKRTWNGRFMGPWAEVYGYVDTAGFFKIPPIYARAFSFTDGGRAAVSGFDACEYVGDTIFSYVPPSRSGNANVRYYTHLIDTAGRTCSGTYCSIKPFGDDLLLAKCGKGSFGVFGASGLLLGDCFYGEPVLADRFLIYADGTDHQYGVMDKSGMVIIPPEYDAIRFLGNSQFELKKGEYITTVYITSDLRLSTIKQRKADSR